jgi:O-antigen ligase
MQRTFAGGLVALLLVGALLFSYIGGAVTAYVLIGVSAILAALYLVNPLRQNRDLGSWTLMASWVLIAIAFALTNQPGRTDFVYAANFAMFALYPLLFGALQKSARPGNVLTVAILSLAGALAAAAIAAFQVLVTHQDRASGLASNPIASSTVALLLGFVSLVGLYATSNNWRVTFFLGPIAGLATVALAGSRGPLLAVPALVIVAMLMLPIRRLYVLGGLAVILIVGTIVVIERPSIAGRLGALPTILEDLIAGHMVPSNVDVSANMRYRILTGSIAAFEQSPWLGYGWYMKVPAVEKYITQSVGFEDPRVAHLHSDILDFGVSAGIVGLIAYLLAILSPMVGAVTSLRDTQYRARLFLATTLSVGFLCCGAVNLQFGFEYTTTVYVVLAAIFLGFCRDEPMVAAD